jgi:hypothetical protein
MALQVADVVAAAVMTAFCALGLRASWVLWEAERAGPYLQRMRRALPWLGDVGRMRLLTAIPSVTVAMSGLTLGTIAAFIAASSIGEAAPAVRVLGVAVFIAGFGVFIICGLIAISAAFFGRPARVVPPVVRRMRRQLLGSR